MTLPAQEAPLDQRQLRLLIETGEDNCAEPLLRQAAASYPAETWPLCDLARLLRKQGKWAEALPIAHEIRVRLPDGMIGYAVASDCHRHLGQFDQAENLLAAAAEKFPDQAWVDRTRAENALAAGRPQRALDSATRLLEKLADEAAHNLCIRILKQLGRVDECRARLELCRTLFPVAPWPAAELAQFALTAMAWDEASALAATLRELAPDDLTGYTIGIRALRAAWRLDEARDLQRQAVTRFPSNQWLHAEGAKIAGDQRDFEREDRLWASFRSRFPDHLDGWLLGARALRDHNKDDEAENLLSQALLRFAGEEKIYLMRARLAEHRLNWNEADVHWQAAIQAFPESRGILLEWATLFSRPPTFAARNLGLTIERLRRCVDAMPDDIPIRVALVHALREAGRLTDAQAAYADAHLLFPLSAELKFALAELEEAAGDSAQAVRNAREAASLQQYRGRSGIATLLGILIRAGKYEEADRVCEDGIARFPADENLRKLFALSAERQEDFRLAHIRWQLAAVALPRDAEIRRHLAESHVRLHSVADSQAARLTAAGAPASQRQASDAALAASFESLGGTGQGCEFGFVQRSLGAEPLGLLRWTNILPDSLIEGLTTRFEGVGDRAQTVIETYNDSRTREYSARDTRFDMMMHTFISAADTPQSKAIKLITQRSSFLRRKLLESLELHDKIYVYKIWGEPLSPAKLDMLFTALSSYGPNWLLYVRLADDRHPAGTLEVVRPRLLIGYNTRFSQAADRTIQRVDMVCWKKLCISALELRNRQSRFEMNIRSIFAF